MPVYLMQIGEDGPMKVGHAYKPHARLNSVQAHCPWTVRLVGLLDGDYVTERALHAKYEAQWIRGEWFKPSPELLAEFSPVPAPQVSARRKPKWNYADVHPSAYAEVERRVAALGLSFLAFLSLVPISEATWRDWRSGKRRPMPARWKGVTRALEKVCARAAEAA